MASQPNLNQFQGIPTGLDGMMPMLTNSIITITGMRDGNIINAILGIIFLTLFNKIMAAIPVIITFIHNKTINYFSKSRINTYATIALSSMSEKRPVGTIVYEKIKDNQENIVVSALINYISGLDTCKFLIFNCDYYVGNHEEFQLKPDIMCRVLKYTKDDKGKICEYIFEIFSYVYDTEYLKNFVSGIVREYNAEKTNNLGKQSYYFNEVYEQIPKAIDGSYRFEMARKNLLFDMVPFHTNKSLRNVFGEHLSIIKKRVDTFINNPRWYEEKGIPYTLGIMLSGPPGTGKTSLIKAVAKDTRRHIFNISLRQTTTQTQLKNLFYNPEIQILKNGGNEIVNIPLDKRLYVIEDIDCLTDIVISRLYKTSQTPDSFFAPSSIAEPKTIIDKIQAPKKNRTQNTNEYSNINNNPIGHKTASGLSSLINEEITELYTPQHIGHSAQLGHFAQLGHLGHPRHLELARHPTHIGNQDQLVYGMSIYDNAASSNLDEMFNTNLTGNTNYFENTDTDIINYKTNGTNGTNGINNTNDTNNNTNNTNNTNNANTDIINKQPQDNNEPNKNKLDPHPEQLNLSFLLNLLDGVLETPGRILIITTNHPERLDKALIRPGRIDIHLQVGNCSKEMIIDILKFFYNKSEITINDWDYKYPITPAEVNKIILNNFDNIDKAIDDIRVKTTNIGNDNMADLICGRD